MDFRSWWHFPKQQSREANFSGGGYETVTSVTAFTGRQDDTHIKIAPASTADPEGPQMTTLAQDNSVAKQLRPLVLMVAAFSLAVAALLVTTASLGASPVISTEIADVL
jgi:hypothetical protein